MEERHMKTVSGISVADIWESFLRGVRTSHTPPSSPSRVLGSDMSSIVVWQAQKP